MAVGRDMDYADVVQATIRVLLRANGPDSGLLSAHLEACLVACERSNELCSTFAGQHEHCPDRFRGDSPVRRRVSGNLQRCAQLIGRAGRRVAGDLASTR
jgi:hypothetical protein